MKALVADDDVVSRIMLQAAVEALGHECLVAADGDDAWQLYQTTSPDVLITDRMMPGIDGLELCRRIRATPTQSYTYIILATSLAERHDILTGMKAGADDYLSKPLDPFDLETGLIAAQRVTTLHAELAAYRLELGRLAHTDALTQLRNRQTLDADLAGIHARSQRSGRAYCVAMCDIDSFKTYNDTYGHQAGDQVLQTLGATLLSQARQGDTVYRYGGEEFLLILADQTLDSGATAGERIRQTVQELAIIHPGRNTAGVVTISVGVAAFNPGDHTTSHQLVAQADAALYQAKTAGRNRVQLAAPSREPAI